MNPLRVAVIGAGVSGLSCAHRLLELSRDRPCPIELNILDGAPKDGGTLRTLEQNGFLMEEGPDCFITEKPAALELCRKLQLEDQLLKTNESLHQSFILKGKTLHPIPEGFYMLAPSRLRPLMTTGLLSPLGKLRASLEMFIKIRRDPQDESVGAFVRRRLGKEVFEALAQPLIGGVYNADPDDLSVNACTPRFKEMELKYGSLLKAMAARKIHSQGQVSGARYSLFVTLKKGMQSLSDALASKIPAEALWLQSPVQSLKPTDKGTWEISTPRGNQEEDAVVLALQPAKMQPLIGSLDREWDKLLSGIPAHNSATLNLGFRRQDIGHPLNGFGFVVPAREKKLIVGCTFASQKFEGRAPSGGALIRVFLGPAAVELHQRAGERAMLESVLEELTPVLGLKDRPLVHHWSTFHQSMSYYKPGHLSQASRLEQKAQEVPGLYLAGNGLRGVGIPDAVASGQAAAENLFHHFFKEV